MLIIEPQSCFQGFYHDPVIGLDSSQARFRCLSCRKAKHINQFGQTSFFRKRKPYMMAICFRCRGAEKETAFASDPNYSPELDLFFSRLISRCRIGAEKRRFVFCIYKEDIMGRYLRNDCRCELTGVLLRPFASRKGTKNLLAPSVDRIDSSKGYTADNIQVVATIVNLMKTDMSMDAFVVWCQRVATYRDLKTQKLADEIEALV